jgi:hypothetical protein
MASEVLHCPPTPPDPGLALVGAVRGQRAVRLVILSWVAPTAGPTCWTHGRARCATSAATAAAGESGGASPDKACRKAAAGLSG